MVFSFSSGGSDPAKQSAYWRTNYKWANLNGYSFMRQGLEKADYNPLLAIGAQPQQAPMPTADSNMSISADLVGAGNSAGYTPQGKAQIENLSANTGQQNANATKLYQEALTQDNVRNNLDADTNYKHAMALATNEKLPWEIRKLGIELLKSMAEVDNIQQNTAESKERSKYYGQNADSNTANADANQYNAYNKGFSTSFHLGPLSVTHTGSPNNYTKHSQGRYHYETEIINGRKTKVKVFD